MEQKKYTRKNKPADNSILSIEGYTPPHSKELEETVLGVLLNEPRRIFDVVEILNEKDFYNERNRAIYKAMIEIHNQGGVIDYILVFEKLLRGEESRLLGITAYDLTKLTNTVTSGVNIQSYCLKLIEYSLSRWQLTLFQQSFHDLKTGAEDVFSVLDKSFAVIEQMKLRIANLQQQSLSDYALNLIQSVKEKIDYARSGEVNPNDVYTGLEAWDAINGRLDPGMIYLVAARPAMGKTAFAIEVIKRVCKRGTPVGFFNLEMTGEQVVQRTYTSTYDVSNDLFKNPDGMTDEEFAKLVQELSDLTTVFPLYIDDNPNISRIVSKIKYWVLVKGVKLIVLDYAQLVVDDSPGAFYKTDVQVISENLEIIRRTCKELKVPIILLAQLNRDNTKRSNKEPMISDLKGSGKFDECAYQIAFLHRPEYYEPGVQVDEFGESIMGLCYLIIAKHRNGPTDRLKFRFVPDKNQFHDWHSYRPFEIKGSMIGSGGKDNEETPF